jgi:hypothetical protein
MYETLLKTKERAFFSYPSFDKYIFYQCHRKNMIDFWPPTIAYNYNIGAKFPNDLTPKEYKKYYKICLFNTSHKAWAKEHETHIELHDATGWAKKIWENYDTIL